MANSEPVSIWSVFRTRSTWHLYARLWLTFYICATFYPETLHAFTDGVPYLAQAMWWAALAALLFELYSLLFKR